MDVRWRNVEVIWWSVLTVVYTAWRDGLRVRSVCQEESCDDAEGMKEEEAAERIPLRRKKSVSVLRTGRVNALARACLWPFVVCDF